MDLWSNSKWILDLWLHFRESMIGQTKNTIEPIKRKNLCLDISNHTKISWKVNLNIISMLDRKNQTMKSHTKMTIKSQNMLIWFFFLVFCMSKFFSSRYFVHSARIFRYFHLNNGSRNACVCVLGSKNGLNKTPQFKVWLQRR